MKYFNKKILCVMMAVLSCFCFSSCGYVADYLFEKWKQEVDSYPDLMEVERYQDESGVHMLEYNNKEYIMCDPVSSPIADDAYTLVMDDAVLVCKVYGAHAFSPLYISRKDIEENVLARMNGRIYAVRKGFTLPSLHNDTFSKVYLRPNGSLVESNERTVAVLENVSLMDFIETEMVAECKMGNPYWDAFSSCGYNMRCIFFDYEYLAVDSIGVMLFEGISYIRYDGLGCGELENGFYKVKDEYQEVFKNEINEGNNV